MQKRIDSATRIGHVHLKVADVRRAEAFYCDALGFSVRQRYGDDAVFLSASDYHHHIGLNAWESKGGEPPGEGTTGLYHFAIVYPSRRALAQAVKRLLDLKVTIDGVSDHGVSEAVYLRDPDGNGIELYWDRDYAEWPIKPDGSLEMGADPLELASLLADVDVASRPDAPDSG